MESETVKPWERSSFGRNVVLPLTGLVLGAIALVIAFVLVTARKQDEEALVSSTRLAETALATKKDNIARNLKDYAFWQDAFDNLHTKVNVQWASTDGNVGANIYNSLGYELAFVLSPDRRTVYAIEEGKPVEIDAMALIPSISSLLLEAAKGGPATVGFMRSGNDVVIAGASAILPPNAADAPAPESRSIMVFVDRIDTQLLEQFSHNYLLRDLKFAPATQPPSAHSASVMLAEPTGTPVGYLTWSPEQPGQAVLHSVIPPLGAVLLALLAFAAVVLRNARRSAMELHRSAGTVAAYARTLETSEARFRDVAEASSDWIWETDAALRLAYVSDRVVEVTNISAADLLGTTLQEFFSSDNSTDGWAQLRSQIGKRASFRDLRCCYDDKQGARRICRIAGRPIVDNNGAFLGYRGTAADVTKEVAAQERANHLALHDPLTGLPNRVLLKDRLNVALEAVRREKTRVAVLCLDLDHFKDVNDTLGHSAGDLLLQQLAHRLQDCVRGTDTVARLGGDEFAIVQVALDQPTDAETLCRRLLEDLKKPFFIEGSELYVGVSVGITISPEDGATQDMLLKNADLALYRAKQAGRGTFRFFEAGMDTELQARKALEQELRRALIKDELQLHYQPLVSLEGHDLKGVEALLRWSHPVRGMVSPGEFIPLAEETGMIVSIGEWVLRTACAQATQWPGLLMAVNVSAIQFKHREFVDTVRQILTETGLEPGRLELEITEGVLLYDTVAALEILNALKALGVRIAMDDFGTGYSSLGYLNSFPFDKIKIDRSFITQVAEQDKSGAIVRSVITLGQSLSMITIAEGVETMEQLDFLRAEGCDQVQGYLFGRPVSSNELTLMLMHKNRGTRLYNYDATKLELLSSTSPSCAPRKQLWAELKSEAGSETCPGSAAAELQQDSRPRRAVPASTLEASTEGDMYCRHNAQAGTDVQYMRAAERRALRQAIAFAHRRGTPLNLLVELQCPISYHNERNSGWNDFRSKFAAWLKKQDHVGRSVDWCAVWASQDPSGERGEVGHLMLHCPTKTIEAKLRRAVRRWCRASGEVATIRRIEWASLSRTKSMRCSARNFIADCIAEEETTLDLNDLNNDKLLTPFGTKYGISEPLSRSARAKWNVLRRIAKGVRVQDRLPAVIDESMTIESEERPVWAAA